MNETQVRQFFTSPQDVTLINSLRLVANRKFIVGSISEKGAFSISANPVEHTTLDSAQLECDRLAKLKPGTSYVAMKVSGGSVVPPVVGVGRF